MTTFRAALVATALALTVAGSAGGAPPSQASPSQARPTDTAITLVKLASRGGDGWCC